MQNQFNTQFNNQFNKVLLATVIGASLATTAYGAADESGFIVLDQRSSAIAEQATQGSLTTPQITEESLDAVAVVSAQASQNIRAATQAANSVAQAQTTALEAADLNTSATGDAALMVVSELSDANGNTSGRIQSSAGSTVDTLTAGLGNAQTAVVNGGNSVRADVVSGSSVAAQVAQSAQSSTANLSEQTASAVRSEVGQTESVATATLSQAQASISQTDLSETAPALARELPLPTLPGGDATPGEPGASLPTPQVTVKGQAQADVSGTAGFSTATQRLDLNTQQRVQTDVGFNSAGQSGANTAVGSTTGGSMGGLTSGVNVLGTGSLLR